MGNAFTHYSPQASWSGRRRAMPLPNPGSFDELHKSCKEVFPQQMEGLKVIINRYLNGHFQVSHHIHMSSMGQSGYHFNTKYMGDPLLGSNETFPLLTGDLDNNGSLNAQAHCLLADRIRSKAVFQTHHSKFLTWQIDAEYRGDSCTGTLTLGNPDLINDSTENWVSTLNIGYGGAHASYYHKANEQIQVGVEFEANTRLQETTFAFGYHLNLPKANVVFKGSVDSAWCVGAVLEKRLPPLPVTLALGAFMNHWKNKFHCGFTIMVG